MADNQKIREKVQVLAERLEISIQDLYSSDKYAAYLDTLAKFHNYYSTRNTIPACKGGIEQNALCPNTRPGSYFQQNAVKILKTPSPRLDDTLIHNSAGISLP